MKFFFYFLFHAPTDSLLSKHGGTVDTDVAGSLYGKAEDDDLDRLLTTSPTTSLGKFSLNSQSNIHNNDEKRAPLSKRSSAIDKLPPIHPTNSSQPTPAENETSDSYNGYPSKPTSGKSRPNSGKSRPNSGQSRPNSGKSRPSSYASRPTLEKTSQTETSRKQPIVGAPVMSLPVRSGDQETVVEVDSRAISAPYERPLSGKSLNQENPEHDQSLYTDRSIGSKKKPITGASVMSLPVRSRDQGTAVAMNPRAISAPHGRPLSGKSSNQENLEHDQPLYTERSIGKSEFAELRGLSFYVPKYVVYWIF